MPRTSLLLAIAVGAFACAEPTAIPITLSTGGGDACDAEDYCKSVWLPLWHGVDVLFVVDRSARMGPAQAKLARAMPELVAALDDLPEGMFARVAFTVAEDPLPACPTVAPAELVLASCREHLDDFAIAGGEDATASACLDVCELDAIEIVPAGRPEGDGPWIEWDRTGNNVAGVDVAKALACAAPQGIAGCEFPAPLGATVSALDQFEANVIVIVSDAADCTLMGDSDGVFDPQGERTFWTDPDATEPMPAICWNAGVTCSGPPDAYDACEAADKDSAGAPADSAHRVLTHAEGNIGSGPWQDIVGIVGVPEGWQRGDAIPFAAAADPVLQREYGIGPGCTGADGSFGLPPVRVRAFVEANPYEPDGATDLWSICADDWGPTMTSIAALARSWIQPMCMPVCVADVDEAGGVQPECTLMLELPSEDGYTTEVLPECEGTLDTATVPPGARGCWLPRTGEAMSTYCSDAGWNLEIDTHWPGTIPVGAGLSASCTPSDDKHVDCPGLP